MEIFKRSLRIAALAGGASLAMVAATCPAQAVQAPGSNAAHAPMLNIPAQSLDRTLSAISRQANVSIMFRKEIVRNYRGPALTGALTPRQAIEQAVSGTNLEAVSMGSGYVVRPRETGLITAPRAVRQVAARLADQPASSAAPSEPAPAAEAPQQDIVVTGSRLTNSGFSAPTPVTVLGAESIAERAPANIIDVLNETPAFRALSSDLRRTGATNQGGVQSLVDLRGLGFERTLVLVDGHRVVATHQAGAVDTNLIPMGVVDRVEVVTGGASAAYGSEAVAGVVNFLIKKNIEGVTATAQYGVTDKGDGSQYTLSLAGGTTFADGRGRIVVGGDYNKSNGIAPYSRKVGQDEIGTVTPSAAQRAAGGLPASMIVSGFEPGNAAVGGLWQASASQAYTFDGNGNPVPFSQGTLYGVNMVGSTSNYGHNVNNIQPLRTPTSRMVGYFHAAYDLTDNVTVYGEANYSRNRTYPYSNAEYISGGNLPSLNILKTNPYLTAATLALIPASSSSISLGRINSDMDGNVLTGTQIIRRLVAGISGKVFGGWDFDLYYQNGQTYHNFQTTGISSAALQKAVNGCTVTSNLSAQQLIDVATYEQLSGKSCVGFNPFGSGRSQQAALNYFQNQQLNQTWYRQQVIAGSISGSPFELWAGPVSVATGAEHRIESIYMISDKLSALGTMYALTNWVPYLGRRSVDEGFVEVGLPLLRDAPIAKSLDFNGAFRRTRYSTSGAVSTWETGLTWDVNDVLRLRATRSRDIRAPALQDIYKVGGLTTRNMINNIPNGTIGANGTVNVNPLGAANTVSVATRISGFNGNPNVKPEIADTFTVGGALNLGRLRASVDYYNVKVVGAIVLLDQQQIADQCRDGVVAQCQLITFDAAAANGIGLLKTTPTNLQTLRARGFDIEVAYRTPLGAGNFTARALVNYVLESSIYSPLTQVTTENVDVLDNPPKIAATLNLGYEVGKFGFDLQLRGFGTRRGNPVLYNSAKTILGPEDAGYAASSTFSTSKNRYPAMVYVNPSISYDVNSRFTVFANVDNLLNSGPPPLVISPTYDLIGRKYRMGVRAKF